MVEIGIVVADATSARRLVQRLLDVFDAASVSLDDAGKEVRVQAERTASQAVSEVLSTVARWLDDGGVSTAQVRLDDRSYTLVGSDERKRVHTGALA